MDKYTQLERINTLKEKWVLTDKEFEAEKKMILWWTEKGEIKNEDSKNVNEAIPGIPKMTSSRKNTYTSLSSYHNKPFDYLSIEDYFFGYWRISRSEYLILNILLIVILMLLLFLTSEYPDSKVIDRLFWMWMVIYFYEMFVFTIKRLHDFNQSGWFSLLPFYNFIAPLFVPWTDGDNRFWPQKR
jgi:hypothetical protein